MGILNCIFGQDENKQKRTWDKPRNFFDKLADETLLKKGLFGKGVEPWYIASYLERGGDAFVRDEKGNTLAHVYPEVSDRLIEKGLDINLLSDEGYSPAMLAAQQSLLTVPLINATSEENLNRIYPNGKTILGTYFKNLAPRKNIVEALLEKGADANKLDASGNTPLSYLASYWWSDMLPILITHGYDVNNKQIEGKSLASLIMCKMPEVLVESENIKLDTRDEDGNTLLHIWARDLERGQSEAIFNKLIGQIDVNAQNNEGQTPLMLALQRGTYMYSYMCHGEPHYDDTTREEEIKILLAHGADVRKTDNKGNTALHYAAKAGLSEIIPVLVKAGAYAWMANGDGAFPHDCAEGIAHEYLKILAGCCAGDYQFHSGFVYNPQPQKITSEPINQAQPDSQNTIG